MCSSGERKSWIDEFFSLSLLANHFPALHGLRTIAILTVLQIHVTQMMRRSGFRINPVFYGFSTNIFFGMDLFFILSGFLIGTMLLHSVDRHEPKRFLRFYARRAFRTFPAYYVVLTLLAVIPTPNPAQRSNLAWEYAYLTNFIPEPINRMVMNWGWSLCVEEHFYLLAPLLMVGLHLFRSHRVRLGALLFLWLVSLGMRLGIYLASDHAWTFAELHRALYRPTYTRFDILVAGVLVAYGHRYFRDRIILLLKRAWFRRLLWTVTLLCLGILLMPSQALGRSAIFRVFAWGTITSLMYVPLILLLLCGEGRLNRFLSRPFFLRAATLGYGIYLVHIPICMSLIFMAKRFNGFFRLPPLVLWPQILVWLVIGSAMAAYLLHLLVEKPMLKLRDRLAT